MPHADPTRPLTGWAKLKRDFVAYAEAMEMSEAELQARHLAQLDHRLCVIETQLAALIPSAEVKGVVA